MSVTVSVRTICGVTSSFRSLQQNCTEGESVLPMYCLRFETEPCKIYVFIAAACIACYFIYLSTAVGLTPGGSTHLHINNTQNNTINKQNNTNNKQNNTNNKFGSVGSAQSLLIIPWHLPYSWGKSMEKPQSGSRRDSKYSQRDSNYSQRDSNYSQRDSKYSQRDSKYKPKRFKV
jgi:hypothetical protein